MRPADEGIAMGDGIEFDEPRRTGRKPRDRGSRLTRSETVTVRLDPKIRYLAELAARKQRRTLSSYIEWALEDSMARVELYHGSGYNNDTSTTVADEAAHLWDVDEAERFARLAIRYPELLTHKEQEWWKLLVDSGLLLPAQSRRPSGQRDWDWATLEDQVFPAIRRCWASFVISYIEGPASARQWAERTFEAVAAGKVYPGVKAKPAPSLDDDIPF
jgi:hypothetical protein